MPGSPDTRYSTLERYFTLECFRNSKPVQASFEEDRFEEGAIGGGSGRVG